MLQDLRYAARAIARSKATTAVLLLSVALGTGANVAVFGVLAALLLRAPAGVGDPARLVTIHTRELGGGPYGLSSYADFLSIASDTPSLAVVAAIDDHAFESVRLGEREQGARVAAVSEDFFAVLEMRPHTGRLLSAADAHDDSVIVVSFLLAERLGGAAEIIGRVLQLRARTYTVVGVTPPYFRGLQIGRECDAWILMRPMTGSRGDRRASIVARLAAGQNASDADAELRNVSDQLAEQYPETNRGGRQAPDAPRAISAIRYAPVDPVTHGQMTVIGVAIVGASLLLLAAACLNTGCILLSRAVTRRHEYAIKLALGATRWMLVRQMLTEVLLLLLAGGVLGLLFAVWTAGAIPALFMAEEAERLDARLDAWLILVTIGVASLAAAMFGAALALRATAVPPAAALRAEAVTVSAGPDGARLRGFLVGAQVAVATVLLLGAWLLVVTLARALDGELAAAARSVAFVSIRLPGSHGDPLRGIASRNALLDGALKVERVAIAGWATTLPLGAGSRRQFQVEGDTAAVRDWVELEANAVTTGYFHAMSLPCIEGRLFGPQDSALGPPVVVVDELLARRYFGAAAVGRYLVDGGGTRVEIVGVVRSGRYRTLQHAPQPTVYYPVSQAYLPQGHLVIRTAGDPSVALPAMRRHAERVTGGTGILRVGTLDAHLSNALALDRVSTLLMGLCGLAALVMSGIGVSGVMSETVRLRTPEIGLRMALGASRAHVATVVYGHAARVAAAGLMAGVAVAFAMVIAARSFVHGVPALGPAGVVAACGGVALVLSAAAVRPLRQALRVSPTIALRAE